MKKYLPLLLLGFLFLAPQAHAISFVQATTSIMSFTNSDAVTFGSNNGVGNTLIIVGFSSNSSATTSISDTAGDSFVLATTTPCSGGGCAFNALQNQIYYVTSTKGGANKVTLTWNATANTSIQALEYSGLSTAPLDQINHNIGGAVSTLSTGNATTTQASELLFSVAGIHNGFSTASTTVTSGWTIEKNSFTNTSNPAQLVADQIVSSIGTYSNTFTFPTSTAGIAADILTFKGTAAASTAPLPDTFFMCSD